MITDASSDPMATWTVIPPSMGVFTVTANNVSWAVNDTTDFFLDAEQTWVIAVFPAGTIFFRNDSAIYTQTSLA